MPAYSPNAVAEHTLALILCLDRHIHRAYKRVRDGNFALDGPARFRPRRQDRGVVGTGQIGRVVARLLWRLRCRVLAHDPLPDEAWSSSGVELRRARRAVRASDVMSLNCPLTPETHHLVDARHDPADEAGRDARQHRARRADRRPTAVHRGSEVAATSDRSPSTSTRRRRPLFFEDRRQEIITDDMFARLLTFPNVLITAHQAFFTEGRWPPSPRRRSPTSTRSPPAVRARTPSGRRDRGHAGDGAVGAGALAEGAATAQAVHGVAGERSLGSVVGHA